MRRRPLSLLAPAALALALVLSACGGGTPAPTASPAPAPAETPSPAPAESPAPVPEEETPAPTGGAPEAEAPVWGEQTCSELFHAPDGALVMTVSYAFPRIENERCPAAGAVNDWYAARAAELLESAAGTADWGVGDYEAAMQAGYDFYPFVEEATFTISRETPAYVSVCREFYANNGGPHPSIFRFSEQFSLEDGRLLGFADFFSNPEEARALVLDAILADPLTVEYDLTGAAAEHFNPEHFYLTDEGFVFWYQTGDLIPQGSPMEYLIPLEALEGQVALW